MKPITEGVIKQTVLASGHTNLESVGKDSLKTLSVNSVVQNSVELNCEVLDIGHELELTAITLAQPIVRSSIESTI